MFKNSSKIIITLIISILLLSFVSISAQDYDFPSDELQERIDFGRKIMDEVEDQPAPKQLTSTSQMFIVRNKSDEERFKSSDPKKRIADKIFNSFTKDYPEINQTKTLIEYLYPSKTMKILRWSYETADDDVWVKTGTNNITRIAANNKSKEYFMQSHITYEDVEQRNLEDYQFVYLGTKKLPVEGKKVECFEIEGTKIKGKDTAYSKSIFYVRKSDFVVVRADLYDLDGEPLKTMRVNKTKKIKGDETYTMITQMGMIMAKEKTQYTIIEMGNIKVDDEAEIDEGKFRSDSL